MLGIFLKIQVLSHTRVWDPQRQVLVSNSFAILMLNTFPRKYYYLSQHNLRRRQWQPTPVLLPGKSHGRRSLVKAAVHRVLKSRTQLNDFTFTCHFHALEKEMATHSSVLAWRIPGTAEPGRLLSMGPHRVGHDWSDLAAAAAALFEIQG